MPKNFQQITACPAKDVKIAGMWIAMQRFLNLKARLFIPRRMSVARPPAKPARSTEPESSALQHIEDAT